MTRMVLVPGVLALLPEYASLVDPVAELRAACLRAVGWLAEAGPVEVLGTPQGARVARALLAEVGPSGPGPAEGAGVSTSSTTATSSTTGSGSSTGAGVSTSSTTGDGGAAYLVVGNGSARRGERAPGHLDDRAFGFDEALGRALRKATFDADLSLAAELLADVGAISRLSELAAGAGPATVDYDGDPYGVQYWVMRWTVP